MFCTTVKGYATIDGDAYAENIVFARFMSLDNCMYGAFAVGNNPLSADAVHPLRLASVTKLNVSTDNLAHYYDPDPEWIVQEVRHCHYHMICTNM